MPRKEGKVNFQLSVTPEEKAMIKANAKSLGMPVNRYVVMVCAIANESTREHNAEIAAEKFKEAMMKGVQGILPGK